MLRWLFRPLLPDLRVNSVCELQPEFLRAQNITGLLLDFDGTLKPHYDTQVAPAEQAWISKVLHAGFRVALLSNGRARRLQALADSLGLPLISNSCKPLPFRCCRALAELEMAAQQTAIVGDQLFTDVLCGRLAGVRTIFVPSMSPTEPIYTRMKRPLERWILARYACT